MMPAVPWKHSAFSRVIAKHKGDGFSRWMDFPERIFFITTVTAQRKQLFRCERTAKLFLDTMFGYRDRGIFELYEFVVMPDHVHLILAPKTTVALERAMQFIKGGYSHRYMKEIGSRIEIWERSFTNHRILDWDDYEKPKRYIHLNPVRLGSRNCRRIIPTLPHVLDFPLTQRRSG
jgi:putative transposase